MGGGKMPVPQSMKAKLWGGVTEREGWEDSFYVTSALACLGFYLYFFMTPDTNIQSWARNEAAARLRLKEEHGFTDFKFGTHYQDKLLDSRRTEWDDLGSKFDPFKEEDDDDDEDDEEEDDE